jgi:hypothetical protein
VGGYQSAHDVLEPDTWSESDDEEEDAVDDEKANARRPRGIKGWGILSEVACAAHDRVRDTALRERAVTRDDLYGWLNANGAGDFNKLHDHGGAESWSGVYYLQCPAPVKPASSDSDSETKWDEVEDGPVYGSGMLGLRCHVSSGDESGGDESVPYLRFQPRVGDLVLFRGDVLHAVESNGWARSGEGRGDPMDLDLKSMRMSVAFNEDSVAADRKAAPAVAA